MISSQKKILTAPCAFFMILMIPVSAVRKLHGRSFLTRRAQRLKTTGNLSMHIGEKELQQFVPRYINERDHLAQIQVSSGAQIEGPKTGFWLVGCFSDTDPDQNRQTYKGEASMTPEVCFNFCKNKWGARFFFLKMGRECSCGRYYHKGPKKGLGGCTATCAGDPTLFCGGQGVETTYQMHDCKAAMYKPKNPFEHLIFRAELYEAKAEFFIGPDIVMPPEKLEPSSDAGDNLGHALNVVVASSKDGFVREAQHFNLDGLNWNTKERDAHLAVTEGERFKTYVQDLRYNSAVMVAVKPTPRIGVMSWSADVEEGLRSLGCPLVHVPEDGEGYVCIGAAHKYTPQSEAFPEGHVAAYGSMLAIEDYLFYEMDCEVSGWYDEGDCTLTCGGGQQLQKRHVTREPANGGEPCPEGFERSLPCNEFFCPIDCSYAEWSGYGECDAPCGPGNNHRYRSIITFPEHGGQECVEKTEELKPCQVVPCPVNCEYAEWEEWTECSEFCGEGETSRSRTHGVEAKYGGLPCNGPANEDTLCFVKPCPVKCEISDWANEGHCTVTCGGGEQKQTRRILTQAQHGGDECPSELEQYLPCNDQACPVNCVMSEWEQDGMCSHSCGGGEVLVRRYIITQPAFGGVACPTTLEQFNDCNTQSCPVDCIIAPWTGWSTCSKTCGEGMQTRTRFEQVVAQFGGRSCPKKKKQTRFCEVLPCKIDGKWGDWKDWSDCNQQCGPGVEHRTRIIAIHAMFGGTPVEGPKEEENKCEIAPCPVECELSDWKDVGDCDKQCGGGLQEQKRVILTEAAHGGGACPGPEGLVQKVECNTYPCPVDCEMTNWEDDGTCSLSCGGGLMKQIRSIQVQPQYGGKPCPTRMEREVPCATDYCPIDCIWNGWTGWSACSEFCGEGTQTRLRMQIVAAEFGGVECEGEPEESRDCQVRPCPIDGKWTAWSGWGECDQQCGPGSTARSRTIDVQPQFGGLPLEGPEAEKKDCNKGPCAVDCEISDWMKEGVCSLTCGGGLQRWKRTILVDAKHGGVECPSTLEKEEPCNTDGCPVDCVLTDWLEDGDCSESCGAGMKMERKSVNVAPANGGKPCPSQLQRAVPCNEHPCPVDCEWAPWSGWNMCDEVCGPGIQTSRRHHAQIAEYGGKQCEGPDSRERTCEIIPCPIDCVFSEWSDWATCDAACGPGFQERSRYHETHAQYGGVPCEGPFSEEQSCKLKDCPVDCEVTPWVETGECTKLCGGGTRREEREIKVQAEAGGSECPSDLFRDVACNTEPCAVDCVLSGWTNDGTCTASCGGGVMHQIKSILVQPDHGGKSCDPITERFIVCEDEACPVNCVWGPWSGWSPCDAACGDGAQTRTRDILVNSEFGGLECEGPFEEEQGCKLTDCPVDAEWAEWDTWGMCDEGCGPGWQTRVRSLAVQAQFGGTPAEGPSYEMRECQIKPCPVDCVVSAWSKEGECGASCGGGDQKEIRTILQAAQHDGLECPSELERLVVCNENPCPVDCELSGWGKDGECSVSCGGGEIVEQRTVVIATENGGRGCDAPLTRRTECGMDPCPVDCVWSQWSGYGDCTVTCGEGKMTRERFTSQDALNGGAECEGESEEEMACGDPCPIHCEWEEWSEFGECSEECGEGEKLRTRGMATRAAYGGKECEGPREETESCNLKECAVDCDITDWVKVSDCSVSCGGGLHQEERTINQQALFGGEECPPNLMRDVPCNLEPCPVDCVMSPYEPFNGCSATCGGGRYTEERVVLTQMANAGVECPPEETWMKEVDCNTHPCPIDCEFAPWQGWQECSHTCGGGVQQRIRDIAVEADHGGAECTGPSEQEQPCNAFFCPVHCEWAEWQGWEDCSEPCGPGISGRHRSVAVSAAYGGKSCDGVAYEEKACQIQYCPVDCIMSDWTNAGVCSTSCGPGKRVQTRTVEIKDDHGGVVCPTSLQQEVDCSAVPCPIDCVLTDWFDEGDCSHTCGGGKQKMIRTIDVAPEHGGKSCDPFQSKHVNCNMHACPIDCEVSEWTEWGECSVSCNTGLKERTRQVTVPTQHGGVVCPESMLEKASCKPIDCPIDCVLETWAPWGDCSQDCGPGTQLRNRGVAIPSQYGGAQCEGAREEQMSCNLRPCPVDCEVSVWSDEGQCSLTCGGGQQKQTRQIDVQAMHGGAECPGLTQYVECNTQNCPIDCEMTNWEVAGDCSLTCGTGQQDFSREVKIAPAFGGIDCPADVTKQELCNEHECPVDCVYAEWSEWGACSASCGTGEMIATRGIAVQREHGGKQCVGPTEKKTHCEPQACPVDCEVSQWAAWESCSATCGAGEQVRRRAVTVGSLHGGKICPDLSQTQNCKVVDCPVHCVITPDWQVDGECSLSCGGGMIPKKRTIVTQPQHGGRVCPPVVKDFACNDHECPVDCEMSDWVDDGGCSAPCGGGMQVQRRFVERQTAYGGSACPEETVRSVQCNTQLCPTMPIGESGVGSFEVSPTMLLQTGNGAKMKGSTGWSTYILNSQQKNPVVISGAPDANAVVQMTGLRRMGVVEELPECPVHLEEAMKQGNLKPLTIKKHEAIGGDPDTCTGLSGENDCHDDDATGGDIIGFVLDEPIIGREADFVKLERSVSWEKDDTCTGIQDEYDCHGTEFNKVLGYIFGPDVPLSRRPGTVALTVKTVSDVCGTLAQFLYQSGAMTEEEIQDPKAVLAQAKFQLETRYGNTVTELEAMTEAEMLTILKSDSETFGVKCNIHDMCTSIEGQNKCHMPNGQGPNEAVIGYIIAQVEEAPAESWDACYKSIRCPIVYDVPVPVEMAEVTKKEAAGVICYGLSDDNVCGDSESPTGGDAIGSVFTKELQGFMMKEITEGMLSGDPSASKVLGYGFAEKQQGTKKKGDAYIVTPGFKEMYAECGSFEKKALKWAFQMKVEFGEDAASQGEIHSSFMMLDQGIYETADQDDSTKHYIFQVGRVKVSGKDKFTNVKFHKAFSAPPVVLSTVQSYNTAKLVKTRAKPATEEEFQVGLETEEGLGMAEDEMVGYLAIEPSKGQIGGLFYDAVNKDGVSDEGTETEYDVHTMTPQIFGGLSSDHSSKAAHVSVSSVDGKKAKVAVYNDAMDDSAHAKEKVGLVIFQGQTMQAAVIKGWLKQRVSYQWKAGLFGMSCSQVCGKGEKTRTVECTSNVESDNKDHTVVDDYYCQEEKPAEKEECGSPCAYFTSDWSVCDATEPGSHGKESRTVACHLSSDGKNADGAMVTDDDCATIELTKPDQKRDCCKPKTQEDFPATHQCGIVSNGCNGDFAKDIDYGECGSDWVCKDHECQCESKPITTSEIATSSANSYGGVLDFRCGDDMVMTGIDAKHSDKYEDREFKFTCAKLDAPAKLGGCEVFSFCGGKEEDKVQCPDNFALVGLSAQPPKNGDRAYEWTCCKVEGIFEEVASGTGDMSAAQKELKFQLESTPGEASGMIIGVDSIFDKKLVDRKFSFSWKSFASKAHCQTCTEKSVTIAKAHAFHQGYLNDFRTGLDFTCPPDEVIQGIKSEYVCRAGWCDLKWNAKCGTVHGAKLVNCGPAEPKSCSTETGDDWTPTEAGWHLQCPRHGVLTKVQSKFITLDGKADRAFKFECCEVEGVGGYKDYATGYTKGNSDQQQWTFDAGANTTITGISSGFITGKQRSFTFFATTFSGDKDCSIEWTKPR